MVAPTDVAVSQAAVVAEGLNTGYGPIDVLHDVSIEVRSGEIVALLGPNGSGKTTLLLTLAGFLQSPDGEIRLFGSPTRKPPHRRARSGLAFIGDDRHVFPSLTVRQNLRFAGGNFDSLGSTFPDLERLWRRKAGLLSGGEQQMLSLARALSTHPKLIIVDELALGLAPLVCRLLLELLREAADEGAAVLVVEQSAHAVLEVADRAYVLRRGEMVDERPAAEWIGRLDELGSLYLS